MDKIIENGFNTDPGAFEPDVILGQEIEVVFKLHKHLHALTGQFLIPLSNDS
jgi:hypothetical protein